MKSKITISFLLITLAIIFSIALTFASIEFPKLTDNFISDNYNFVNVYTGADELQNIKTELFINHFHLRTIGYFSLGIILILILVGYITEKTGLASLGAIAVFLPVFGHFAATMFFLGGLGFLRLLWLPCLDVTFDIMKLGDAIFIPYRIILDIFNLVGINLVQILPYIFIISGLFIFCFGTAVWLYSYFMQEGIANYWIYKKSRHPQYLGWIIWSYGILLLPGENMKQSYFISDTLPWLIAALIIIGVAMVEEIKMSKKFRWEYENYRKSSYFMFPFPKYFCKVISSPFRTFFKKTYPTKKYEIVTVLSFYFFLVIVLTFILNTFAVMKAPGKWVFDQQDKRNLKELVNDFVNVEERREKFAISERLVAKGDSAVQSLINLLNCRDLVVREFSADALGKLKSEKAVPYLIKALGENNWRVQNSVINALGNYNSKDATDLLINLLESDNENIRNSAAFALAKICNYSAQNILIKKLEENLIKPNNALILCLANNKSEEAVDLLIELTKQENLQFRQTAVIGLMETKSEKAIPVLKKLTNDDNWEVRLYAEEALKEIVKN